MEQQTSKETFLGKFFTFLFMHLTGKINSNDLEGSFLKSVLKNYRTSANFGEWKNNHGSKFLEDLDEEIKKHICVLETKLRNSFKKCMESEQKFGYRRRSSRKVPMMKTTVKRKKVVSKRR
jgi:SPX domain protein involved in polyphosphate accumulation